MGRILGIDYGTKRVGLAISDPLGMLSTPLSIETVGSMEDAIKTVCRIARERAVEKIVVGMPINMNGTMGPIAMEVTRFVELLKPACGIAVETIDERLSTSMVERVLLDADLSRGRRKEVRDKLAAQVILQGYLDKQQGAMPYDEDPDQAPYDPS